MILLVVLALVAATLIGGVIWAVRALGTHTSKWTDSTAAAGFDLEFDATGVLDLPFDIFQRVSDKRAWTQISRSDSNDRTFLYKFEVGRSEGERKERRTCALIEIGGGSPHTTVRPHALQTLPPAPTDGQDVAISSAAFTEVFRVQSSDPTFARSVIGADFANWMLTPEGRVGSVELEVRDGWLLAIGPRISSPDELMNFHEWGQQLRRRLLTPAG